MYKVILAALALYMLVALARRIFLAKEDGWQEHLRNFIVGVVVWALFFMLSRLADWGNLNTSLQDGTASVLPVAGMIFGVTAGYVIFMSSHKRRWWYWLLPPVITVAGIILMEFGSAAETARDLTANSDIPALAVLMSYLAIAVAAGAVVADSVHRVRRRHR